MDDHCKLEQGEVFEDYDCMLTFVNEKSDKFYCIQLLRNSRGFYVWTRWGRNGTDGQNKLEGPISQVDAEKSFQNKFVDKTKNNWNKREQFIPVKGKYILVQKQGCSLCRQNVKKPSLPDEFSADVQLPADIVYAILSLLPTRDILRCMQVCKSWKVLLSDKYFWKMFIQRHFDLGIKSDISNDHPVAQWSDPKEWFCYYNNEDDAYVVRPFPTIWNCGVVHPYGLDPISGDMKSLQGFSRSLEILIHMKKEVSRLNITSGGQCSGSEGEDEICVVLFPWEDDKLPMPLDILNKTFHFHPEIFEYYKNRPEDQGELRNEKLYFHVRPEPTENSDEDDNEDDHDIREKPCLNRIFGMDLPGENELWKYEATRKFYEWLQPIMVPSVTVYAGEDKLNPVIVFMVAKLAPGWVGGALTGVIYT